MKLSFGIVTLSIFLFLASTSYATTITCGSEKCGSGLAGSQYDDSCPPVKNVSPPQGWSFFYRCSSECHDDRGNTWTYEFRRFACCVAALNDTSCKNQ